MYNKEKARKEGRNKNAHCLKAIEKALADVGVDVEWWALLKSFCRITKKSHIYSEV